VLDESLKCAASLHVTVGHIACEIATGPSRIRPSFTGHFRGSV
jgi:hypothetical protein